jgi:DNA-binding NarL/FixJ family response regulator
METWWRGWRAPIPRDGGFSMKCKLVIADDHKLMRTAIRVALDDAPDMEIVGEAEAGDQLLPLVGRTSPDVVVLDLRMPRMDGLRCLELLHERHPGVKAIVLSASDDRAAVTACFARGAIAFFNKSVDPVNLAAVVRQAVAGNAFFALGEGSGVADAQTELDLTPRETEILRALAEGRSNKQMAQEFWLSAQTIKYHLTHIYRKLGVNSRTEAVRQAYEHGLIENPVLRTPLALV